MSFIEGIPELEGGLGDILSLLGFAKGESMADEITRLYQEADTLAVFTIKVTIALFWWAAHMGTATASALGYSQQIQDATATANKYQLETWRQFLQIKQPAEIRRVYIRTTKQIRTVQKITQVQQKVNLKPIKRELAALEKWKLHTVSPDLKRLMLFWHAWEKTYKHPVVLWVKWLRSPRLFAQWAVMPLIAQLPTALPNPRVQSQATRIATVMVDMWQNDPGQVYDGVLNWLVKEP